MRKSVSKKQLQASAGGKKSLRESCPKCACKRAYRGGWCPQCGTYWTGSKDRALEPIALDAYLRRPVSERLFLSEVWS